MEGVHHHPNFITEVKDKRIDTCDISTRPHMATPEMIVYKATMEANMWEMSRKMRSSTNVKVRPHLKSYNCGFLQSELVARLANLMITGMSESDPSTGFCVKTIEDADELFQAGLVPSLLITEPIVSNETVDILVQRMNLLGPERKHKIRIALSETKEIQDIGEAWRNVRKEPSTKIDVLINLDVGIRRIEARARGPTSRNVHQLAAYITWGPYRNELSLISVQALEGRPCDSSLYAWGAFLRPDHLLHEIFHSGVRRGMKTLASVAKDLRSRHHDIQVVSAGGTYAAETCAGLEGITEVQPETFLVGTDRRSYYWMRDDYPEATFPNAFAILTTVMSVDASEGGGGRATVDAGRQITGHLGFIECEGGGRDYTYTVLDDDNKGMIVWGKDTPNLIPGQKFMLIPHALWPAVSLKSSLRKWQVDSGNTNRSPWIQMGYTMFEES